MMKKLLSLVVAALLTVSAVATSASAAKFTDVDATNEALNDAVELLVALNVTTGTTDTTYGTTENVTRAQMATFIYRMMKAGKHAPTGGANTTKFTDLDDPFYYFTIAWANDTGVIKGRNETTFDPKGGIILQDAYTMIVRALGYDNGTLSYPIGYITKAEEIGLDADLDSKINYDTVLTRGDVAILLANMFYAETAETYIEYETKYVEVHKTGCDTPADECTDMTHFDVVSGGMTPVESHKTVAEDIFEVTKVAQRVVATPNYSFNNLGGQLESDVEMVKFATTPVDYADNYTLNALGEVAFEELGLEGKADDYFLSDILMFVKWNKSAQKWDIFGATAQGTKKTVSFDDIEFGTVSGTAADKYYDSDKEFKKFNGKLVIDGVDTYVAEAPYSYTKHSTANKFNAKFITLDAFQGDLEDEDEKKVYFDYKTDATLNAVFADGVVNHDDFIGFDGTNFDKNGEFAQMFFGGLGEVDVYDCDGDGRYEYIFVKNYLTGRIDTTEDTLLSLGDDIEDDIATDMAIVEGEKFADNDYVVAYANEAAKYVKVIEVLKATEADLISVDEKFAELSNGTKIALADYSFITANANIDLIYLTGNLVDSLGDTIDCYFTADGALVWINASPAASVSTNENWVVVLEGSAGQNSVLVDGILSTDNYVKVYNDGSIKSIKVKKVDACDCTNHPSAGCVQDADTPAVDPAVSNAYATAGYVNKLATAKADSKGRYYFNILADANTTGTDMDTKDTSKQVVVTGADDVTLSQYRGNLYTLADVNTNDAYINTLKYVYVRPYTQIILRTKDTDGEEIVTLYGYENLPDIKEDTKFQNVSYVLGNNTATGSAEDLVVFYGTLATELEGDTGDVEEVRIVKSRAVKYTDEKTVITYSLFNPFTGETETGVEAADSDSDSLVAFDIVGLTTQGYVDPTKAGSLKLDASTNNVVDSFYDIDGTFTGLGYAEVDEFVEESGYLALVDVAADFEITDETVVTLLDVSASTIKVVDKSVLASTSKSYRYQDDVNNNIRAFVCAEEDADEEGYYFCKFVVIVKD